MARQPRRVTRLNNFTRRIVDREVRRLQRLNTGTVMRRFDLTPIIEGLSRFAPTFGVEQIAAMKDRQWARAYVRQFDRKHRPKLRDATGNLVPMNGWIPVGKNTRIEAVDSTEDDWRRWWMIESEQKQRNDEGSVRRLRDILDAIDAKEKEGPEFRTFGEYWQAKFNFSPTDDDDDGDDDGDDDIGDDPDDDPDPVPA